VTAPVPADAEARLLLYRRAAAALGAFFRRFTSPFCASCLEVTRRHHAGDPRADVELLQGVFPGCCQAGVADALWVPRSGDAGRFPETLVRAMDRARSEVAAPASEPLSYLVRERQTGLVAEGFGCVYGGDRGCLLGDLKAPLCLGYACEPVREAVAAVLGREWVGADTDDFSGCLAALRACVASSLEEAEEEVRALAARLAAGAEALGRWERENATTLFEAYGSSTCASSPSWSTR
jgi:hypothetical protein